MAINDGNEEVARSGLFVGRFEIREKLGEGATGDVYKVKDTILKRKAAIKFLRFRNNEERKVLRFQREAKASSKLKHLGLIEVYDFGIADDGTPYLVMELIEGDSLEAVLKESGSMETHRALRIASLTAEAMQHAHAHKVIHRDLKPSNIMIVNSGPKEQVKVLDFGLAAILEDDGVARTMNSSSLGLSGTPNYMSPEQANRKGVDERADIYSLGCILFNLIAGRPPYLGESTMATIEQHMRAEVPDLRKLAPERRISTLLNSTVTKMLDKDPARRFQNMTEVISAIDACRQESTTDINAEQPQEKTVTARNKPGLKPIPITVLFTAIGLTATVYYFSVPVKNPRAKPTVKSTLIRAKSTPQADAPDLVFNIAASVAGDTTGDVPLTQRMQLNGEAITDGVVSNILNDNPTIERLNLSETTVTDKCTALMIKNKNLKIINLISCKSLTNDALLPFQRMPQLETLNLRGSTGITDKGLETLSKCPQLIEILVGNNPNITARGVEKLAVLPVLCHIGLGNTSVKGTDFQVLDKLKKVALLTLEFQTIDVEDTKAIAKLKFVKYLQLTSSRMSDEALLELAEMPNLEVLRLAATKGYSPVALALLNQKIEGHCTIEMEQPYKGLHFNIKRPQLQNTSR